MVQWLPVVGWEGIYEVSDQGEVRSVSRTVLSKDGRSWALSSNAMTPYIDPKTGYRSLRLTTNGRRVTKRIHVIVLEAFRGSRPTGFVSCHNDGDPSNNRVDNLRWDSQSENLNDAVRHKTHYNTKKTACKRRGHPFSAENTYINPTSGGRQCRACMKEARKNYCDKNSIAGRTS